VVKLEAIDPPCRHPTADAPALVKYRAGDACCIQEAGGGESRHARANYCDVISHFNSSRGFTRVDPRQTCGHVDARPSARRELTQTVSSRYIPAPARRENWARGSEGRLE
jgi:hypothetical protein